MTRASVLKMPDGFPVGRRRLPHTRTRAITTTTSGPPGKSSPAASRGADGAARPPVWWNLETAAADFDRAAELGMNSLRLSVEWSRIEPREGRLRRGRAGISTAR